jgi:apolipoprotein N-acyltransferase
VKRLSNSLGDILAMLAGCSMPLAFAPFALFPIAILATTVLFLLWQQVSFQRAFWRGLLFGIGMFGSGVSWVSISFHQFGGVSLPGAIILTVGFVMLMALYIAILGGILVYGQQIILAKKPINQIHLPFLLLIFPSSWVIMEWIRGWLFTGFPWLSLGYSQIDSPLRGFAPLIGAYGISWLTVTTASFLIYLGYHLQPFRISNWRHWVRGLLAITTIWISGWLLTTISWSQAIDKPIKVALIQGNVPQEFKWLSDFQLPSMMNYLKLSQEHRDADLIIWPETAIPMFYQDIPQYIPGYLEQLKIEHTDYDTDFLIGVPILDEQKKYFNSVMSISKQPGTYFKHHLVPFGEYIPLQLILGNLLKLLNVPMSEFSAGTVQQNNLYSAGQPIGVSICYEDVFADLIRHSLPQATLLVNVSNDAWFGDSIAPHQHLEMARMRALESGRYLLRATNTGISAVIDPQGKISHQTSQFQRQVLRATVQPYQGTTPYLQIGNTLLIIILISTLSTGLLITKFNHTNHDEN